MALTDYDLMAWSKNASRDIAEMAQTLLAYRSIPEMEEVDMLAKKIKIMSHRLGVKLYGEELEQHCEINDLTNRLRDIARRAIVLRIME